MEQIELLVEIKDMGIRPEATGNYMEFKAPIPDEFREVLDKLSFSHPGTLMK